MHPRTGATTYQGHVSSDECMLSEEELPGATSEDEVNIIYINIKNIYVNMSGKIISSFILEYYIL